ncbi:hypothetical protein HIM_01962 [Hirsutella minnesotensis 3608]|nr:hypothetical protein HIM_01962 [Hirsutella minnesotensis 3608]
MSFRRYAVVTPARQLSHRPTSIVSPWTRRSSTVAAPAESSAPDSIPPESSAPASKPPSPPTPVARPASKAFSSAAPFKPTAEPPGTNSRPPFRAMPSAASSTQSSAPAVDSPQGSRAWLHGQRQPDEPAYRSSRAAPPPKSRPSPPILSSIDWANSFYGVSTQPVTEDQFKVLMEPIDVKDIEVKSDGIIYLPEIKYRRRLNEAFGPMGWGLIPKGEPVAGASIVTREYALIIGGRFVSQAQGENNFFSPEQLPSAIEGCKSNALMRCCKDLGVAAELWDPVFIRWFKKAHMEEAWVEHATTKKRRTQWFKKGAVEVVYPYRLAK